MPTDQGTLRQATAALGYGYKFCDSAATKLDGTIGLGFRQSDLRGTSESKNDGIIRGTLAYSRKMTDTTNV